MNKVLIFLIFITFSFSESPSFDFSYEMKYGDGTGVTNEGNTIYDLNFNENFLKINSNYKNYHLYFELEYSDPPVLGYSSVDVKDIFSRFYMDSQFNQLYLKVGNIYTLYGAGLGLYTFPDQNIDFDNSLLGLEFKYSLNPYYELFIVGGASDLEQRTNPAILIPNRFSENSVIAAGVNYDTRYGYGHILIKNQETYMDNSTLITFNIDEGNRSTLLDFDFAERLDQMIVNSGLSQADFFATLNGDSLNTKSFVLGYGIYSDFGDFYFEIEQSEYDKLLGSRVDGSRAYFSYGQNFGNLGFSYEYKNYDMPYDILTFTAPPTVAIESTSILASRNTHSVNYGDEVGHQFEIITPLWGDMDFLGNVSVSRRHKAKNKIYNFSRSNVVDYINSQTFSGVSGQEDEYISELLNDCDIFIQDQDNMDYVENNFNELTLLDYISFEDESEEFISFYPYRQVYGEISGYINDGLYIKGGLDIYNEVIKHKDQEVFNYSENELNAAFDVFYSNAEQVVNNRWQEHFDSCSQLIGFGIDCGGINSAEDYANQEFFNQFGMSREDYLASLSFDAESLPSSSNHYRQIVDAWTIPTQFTYSLDGAFYSLEGWLNNIKNSWNEIVPYLSIDKPIILTRGSGKSLNIYLEYQEKQIAEIIKYNIKDLYFSGSYTHNNFLTFTLFYEKEDKVYPSQTSSDSWSGLDLSFDLEDYGQLSLFYGSQKGGRVCANGICADQPGFEDGLKVTYRTFF
tara:strand:- start:434 stop:2653 length:2220 start_codon:yes stop_codon:yes gene_type:complete